MHKGRIFPFSNKILNALILEALTWRKLALVTFVYSKYIFVLRSLLNDRAAQFFCIEWMFTNYSLLRSSDVLPFLTEIESFPILFVYVAKYLARKKLDHIILPIGLVLWHGKAIVHLLLCRYFCSVHYLKRTNLFLLDNKCRSSPLRHFASESFTSEYSSIRTRSENTKWKAWQYKVPVLGTLVLCILPTRAHSNKCSWVDWGSHSCYVTKMKSGRTKWLWSPQMNEFEIALANAMLLQLLHFIWYVKNDKKLPSLGFQF